METAFTPLASLFGGMMIGLSAVIMMLGFGRIAGISGIIARVLPPKADTKDQSWLITFLIGMMIAPLLAILAQGGQSLDITISSPWPLFLLGGLLVGFGAVWGNGCTSGHGVCGISRFSVRSIAATITFMATAFLTVTVLFFAGVL